MMGRRVLPLMVGLWAGSALGQFPTVTANQSILLSDAGTALARAYFVSSGGAEYVLVNAGALILVYDTNGVEHTELEPPQTSNGFFQSFAVANFVQIGSTAFTTLVAAAEFGSAACSLAVCLDIYFWDSTSGFQLQTPANTTVVNANAMAIDARSSPINIYYATNTPSTLYEQSITVSASTGAVSVGALNSRSLTTGIVQGLTVDVNAGKTTLYLSDSNSNLYTFPTDATNLDGGIFAQPGGGQYSLLSGLFFVADAGASYILGGGFGSGVYILNPYDSTNLSLGGFVVKAADAGPTSPAAASLNATGALMAVTEDLTSNVGPWLHLVVPDAGSVIPPPVDAGVDAGTDAGTLPTIPVIAPGPGVAPPPTNSCNCSTAGSAPMLLILLLPLLVPRRRR